MYTGKGIGVAVLDTGIFPHIDFGSRISVFRDFTGVRRSPYDDNGHGTHVSGILAGDGTASGGKYKGSINRNGKYAPIFDTDFWVMQPFGRTPWSFPGSPETGA